jgi:hypothetical protein
MRWMIGGQGWPIAGGARLLPSGTLVSDDGDPLAIPLSELPVPLPLNSVSLDDAALAQMRAWYPSYHHHMLLAGPDVGKPQQAASVPKKSAKGS